MVMSYAYLIDQLINLLMSLLKLSFTVRTKTNYFMIYGGIKYLLYWILSLEENPSAQEFSKNAAHRPHVDRGRVVVRSHKNLRCSGNRTILLLVITLDLSYFILVFNFILNKTSKKA